MCHFQIRPKSASDVEFSNFVENTIFNKIGNPTFDVFCYIEKWQLFACIGSDKQAQLRPRPKEPFGLGAKAERPKLMRCISKTKKAPRKAPLLVGSRNKLFFLSSPLMDWSSHGQNFAQNLMKRFPYMYPCLRV